MVVIGSATECERVFGRTVIGDRDAANAVSGRGGSLAAKSTREKPIFDVRSGPGADAERAPATPSGSTDPDGT